MDVPVALSELPQWIVWGYRGEDLRKVPFNPSSGAPAKSNDPGTWGTLEAAQRTFSDYDSRSGSFDGLGFVFSETDSLFGLDLDGCIGDDGELAEWAQVVIDELQTYAEISPSGTGVKLFGIGKVPGETGRKTSIDAPAVCSKTPGIEVYDHGRYFAFTGDRFAGAPLELSDCQQALDRICGKFWPAPEPAPVASSSRTYETPIEERAARYIEQIPGAISGAGGHNATFRVACVLVLGFNLTPEQAFAVLSQWNTKCEPPWNDKDLWHKITDAGRQSGDRGFLAEGRQYQGHDVDLAKLLASLDPVEQAPGIPIDPGGLTPDCLSPPGLIRQIIRYNLQTAIYPQPELALAAALALMATLIGRKVTDCYGTRSNVFILGLAPSGAGKEHARKVNKEILLRASAENMIGPERIGSGAGIVTAVHENPVLLLQIDEIGRLLETMKNPGKSPHLYNVATVLMQMYGASDSLWIGDAYADSKKTRKINQPHPVLYGTSTPDQFWGSLTADNVSDGFLGRLLPFEAPGDGYAQMQQPQQIECPKDIIDAVQWWLAFNPTGGNLSDANPQPTVAQFEADALDRLQGHMAKICDKRTGEDARDAAVWSRTAGKTSKLALILACSRQTYCKGGITIRIDDVERAIKISNMLTRKMLRKAVDHISENEHEEHAKRVLRLLSKPLTASELTRKTQWLRRRDREEILTTLIESGMVELTTEQTGGRPRNIYRQRVQSS